MKKITEKRKKKSKHIFELMTGTVYIGWDFSTICLKKKQQQKNPNLMMFCSGCTVPAHWWIGEKSVSIMSSIQ